MHFNVIYRLKNENKTRILIRIMWLSMFVEGGAGGGNPSHIPFGAWRSIPLGSMRTKDQATSEINTLSTIK